ncbi:phytoene desaturase [Nocardioides luteus]|uniref:Phytoene desaturase n=1 Tax=Nocardioides luteus TaxID=1844 RepID=A0ABQ5STF4_9ACTN|nr:phytoene desaturase family protein [Nocardioides luteus]MDR7311383.1 phytoene desaturase [Nocardioides luteus]GGR65528.1 phytoene desaturase [Nocardioides luteus]GLJ66888.1 phytoene desaturase [Nocardioides luteus]
MSLPGRLSRLTATSRRAGDGSPQRVVVVGGGIAGLATAALLASRGHSVDLLEKNGDLGGRVGSVERDGFRFDTGASWYLMPEVFEHFFSLLGTTAETEFDLTVLDPSYRVFFEGHSEPVDLRPDRAHNRALFERLEPGAGDRFDAYLRSADDTYDMALRRFLYTSFDSPTAFAHPDVLRRTPALGRLLTRSLESHVAGAFADHRLRQVLGYPAVFLGSSPSRTPSMYHLMSRLDLGDRVLYPQGGFTRLIQVIANLAEKHGARLHTGAAVTRILTTDAAGGRPVVAGVEHDSPEGSRTVEADVVVGAADLHHLETALLPARLQTHPERAWRGRSAGPGAVLAMLGVEGRLPQLPHHSLFFTRDWGQNFGDIFGKDARVPDPASIYVCKPSETDSTVAPEGCENLFVLVPVPSDTSIGSGGDDGAGSETVERTADAAIDQIASWAGVPDLRDRIRVRHTVGPEDFATRYHSWRGGALGLEHTLRQSAFLRPRNASARVDGLLYAGASTVPGVGLPMCLISAELVLKRLSGDRSSLPMEA